MTAQFFSSAKFGTIDLNKISKYTPIATWSLFSWTPWLAIWKNETNVQPPHTGGLPTFIQLIIKTCLQKEKEEPKLLLSVKAAEVNSEN